MTMKRNNKYKQVVAVFVFITASLFFLRFLFVDYFADRFFLDKFDLLSRNLSDAKVSLEYDISHELADLEFNCGENDVDLLKKNNISNSRYRVHGIKLKNGGGCSSLDRDLDIVSVNGDYKYSYKINGYNASLVSTHSGNSVDKESIIIVNVNGDLAYWIVNGAFTQKLLNEPCENCFYLEYNNAVGRGNPDIVTRDKYDVIYKGMEEDSIGFTLFAGDELRNYVSDLLGKSVIIFILALFMAFISVVAILSYRSKNLTAMLRLGVDNHEFIPFYQPVIDIKTSRVVGMEALIRWIRNGDAIVNPSEFIDAAESSNVILDMTMSMLNIIISDLSDIPDDIWVSVNIIPSQLESGALYEFLVKLNPLYASRLRFEITERIKFSDFSSAKAEIDKIRGLGCDFKLDDFGTGYSGFSYIQRLGVTDVKIDKMFIDTIVPGDNKAVLDSIIDFCNGMDVAVMAEGVESQEQVDYLMRKGVCKIQGYFYSEPVPLEQLLAWMKSRYEISS